MGCIVVRKHLCLLACSRSTLQALQASAAGQRTGRRGMDLTRLRSVPCCCYVHVSLASCTLRIKQFAFWDICATPSQLQIQNSSILQQALRSASSTLVSSLSTAAASAIARLWWAATCSVQVNPRMLATARGPTAAVGVWNPEASDRMHNKEHQLMRPNVVWKCRPLSESQTLTVHP